MSRFFYGKLAISNIKKNTRSYVPYILTCVGTIMMYYIIRGLSLNSHLSEVYGGQQIGFTLGLGCWVIGIFAVIFLFYTNSFLIKRRKKEFGIYNILGMEKHHLARVVMWESIDTFLISMTAGVAGGVLFSKLAYLGIGKLLRFTKLEFEITPKAMLEALFLFGAIYLVNLVNTLWQIYRANLVELLKGGNVGEKEPKTRWIMAIAGCILLGAGYYLAITVNNPVDAVILFLIAVILVILATYLLFTAGSIAILKLMRKNKKFYYQANHFISVSGMMYRMKQNAAGLASICVLSTGVLILLSTTVCMYLGTEDALRIQHPRNLSINIPMEQEGDREEVENFCKDVLETHGIKPQNTLEYSETYELLGEHGASLLKAEQETIVNFNDVIQMNCISLEDYNRLMREKKELKSDEILFYSNGKSYEKNSIQIGNSVYHIKEKLREEVVPDDAEKNMLTTYTVIVKDHKVVSEMEKSLGGKNPSWSLNYGFDFPEGVEDQEQEQIYHEISKELEKSSVDGYVRSNIISRVTFYALNGGMLFIGILLGMMFLMATVLIIYYKQISEGYEDRERYQIMKKVGMSRKEIKSSIRSQVLTVFYLPLLMAGVHILFAFNMIQKVLNIFSLYNTGLFILCTIGTMVLFAGLYCFVYGMTAKTYYKIIS